MSPNLATLLQRTCHELSTDFHASLFRLASKKDGEDLMRLLTTNPDIQIVDESNLIAYELGKIIGPDAQESSTKDNGFRQLEQSIWVYFPWRRVLVRIADEREFIALRTLRNKYKITHDEQEILASKRVGVIGLSVGQSVALPLAMERICGVLRIADFDNLELSNTNRIRSSLLNIGLPKTTILAREIAEMDPFLKVEVFQEAIDEVNIEDFLTKNGRLDLVVDECDDLKTKFLIRKVARKLGIPVLMDTSDNLFLDIERYDLDPNYPLFHGLVSLEMFEKLDNPEIRRKLLFDLLDFESISERGKYSISEIGKTITTWPQLATDVVAGGAICAKVVKSILLGDKELGGRVKIDLIQEIKERSKKPNY